MADFCDRSLGIGYTGGSSLLLALLLGTLALWYFAEGSISVQTVYRPRVEAFYWAAITFSQTLGTALGDWIADTTGLGYEGGAMVFSAALVVVAALYYRTNISRVALFWTRFILTRPLGATVGDFLDKPLNHGGMALSRPSRLPLSRCSSLGAFALCPSAQGGIPANLRPSARDRTGLPAQPANCRTGPSAGARFVQNVNRTDEYQEKRSVSSVFWIPRLTYPSRWKFSFRSYRQPIPTLLVAGVPPEVAV